MRVLHVFKSYWPETFGGIERAVHSIAEGTAALGVSSTVFTLADQPNNLPETFASHSIIRARRILNLASTGFSVDAFGLFRKAALEADIVHYHFPWPFMDALHFVSRVRKPSILTYHSDIVKQRLLFNLYRPVMHHFLSDMDAIVATSPNYAATSETLASFEDRQHTIPLGLDQRDYPAALPEISAKWRARFTRPFLLFIGVFRYYKGLHFLIEAAKTTSADIVLVGAGPEEGALREQVSRLSLENVHFVGPLEDIDKIALLELSRGFVFPSHLRSEAYGLSLIEAAMMGKPMITCDIGSGMSFINRHGETGFVVAPRDPQALSAAMQQFVDDSEFAHRLGQAAQKRYRERFTAERMSKAYIELYRNVVTFAKTR